jgi:hypothetical protein
MDRYRHNLKRAGYDWREDRAPGKDRTNGRAEKRSARQRDRVETEADVITYVDNVRYDDFLARELMGLDD